VSPLTTVQFTVGGLFPTSYEDADPRRFAML